MQTKDKSLLEEIRKSPGFLLRRMHQIANAQYAHIFGDRSITGVQISCLAAIAAQGEANISTVADLVAYDKVTTGNVLKRLLRRGLISEHPAPLDGRSRVFNLKPAGEKLLCEAKALLPQGSSRTLEPLDEKEREIFVALLEKLVTAHSLT